MRIILSWFCLARFSKVTWFWVPQYLSIQLGGPWVSESSGHRCTEKPIKAVSKWAPKIPSLEKSCPLAFRKQEYTGRNCFTDLCKKTHHGETLSQKKFLPNSFSEVLVYALKPDGLCPLHIFILSADVIIIHVSKFSF